MDDVKITLERHNQEIQKLIEDMSGLKEVQAEIRSMNETLVILANELKHANVHLERHEQKISEIEAQPKNRINQIITAIVSAVAGGLISTLISVIIKTH